MRSAYRWLERLAPPAALFFMATGLTYWYLSQQGFQASILPPFVWRDTDQFPCEQETCNTMMALARGIKFGIENSQEMGELRTIREIVEAVTTQHLTPEPCYGFAAHGGLTKDGWGNDFKVKKNAINGDLTSVLIYSTTPNAFPRNNGEYNLFVELTIGPGRNVCIEGTTISKGGQILRVHRLGGGKG